MYKIENKAKDIILKYKQEGGTCVEYCDTNESNRFAWDNLYDKHTVEIEAWIKGTKKKRLCKVKVELDVMEKNDEMQYDLRDIYNESDVSKSDFQDMKRVLTYRTHTNGYTKILTFDDKKSLNEEKEIEDHTPELIMNIELGGLGISLISEGTSGPLSDRREIIFCSLRDIQAICIDFKTERRLQLRIGLTQIDNQLTFDTPFPVTVFSENKKAEKDGEKIKPFFNLNLIIAKDVPDVMYFKKIEFLIQKLVIQLDDELMLNIVEFCNIVMNTLKTTFTGINEIFVPQNQIKDQFNHSIIHSADQSIPKRLITKVPDWKIIEIETSKQHIYIKYYSSSPLSLRISFYSTMKIQSDPGFNNALKRFGLALNTIESAPININALQLKEVVGTQDDIMYILKDRYMIRLKRNLFSILGASSLIGNPIQLVNNVSSGVKDFFYKPIEGLIEGPIEGGKGFVKGTGSLFKHTVQGTFGSTSSIFSSLSKGVLVIANDKDYMKEREANHYRDRPDNFIEGFGYGLESAAKSVGSGVTNLVRMPVVGAKKKGILGFFSGTVKGVTGLVVKPVSGVMDLISKTSEGIKNTATMFEGKKQGNDRIRLPRTFYAKERIFKEFNELHSFSMAYLFKHKKMTEGDYFIDALIVSKEPIQILVVCEAKLLKIHINKDKVTLSVPIIRIKKIEKSEKMLILWILDNERRRSKIKIDIESDAV